MAFLGKKLLVLIIAALASVSWAVYSFMGSAAPMEKLNLDSMLTGKKNIVVLGCDSRPEDNDTGRSDTLFVVMLDPKTKESAFLSIPRDTRVKIKGHGWDKINHAFAYGGETLTRDTVQNFLGLHIDNYVVVDFKGFQGLVDAIGGVDIDVEKRMYYYDDWDGFKVDLYPGQQHMDGKTAIQYVRYRDEEGDIGRITRQQKFLKAVYDKILSPAIITKLPGLIKSISTMLNTDLSVSELVDLAKAMKSMKDGGVHMAMVPGTPKYIDGISYWLPDILKMRNLMASMQGQEMTDKYRSASQSLAREYQQTMESDTVETPKDKKKQDDFDAGRQQQARTSKKPASTKIPEQAPAKTTPAKPGSGSDSTTSSGGALTRPPSLKPAAGNN